MPVPKPEPGGLVVKVEACAVCGTDVKCYHHGHRNIVMPRVTGHEMAGVVSEIGEGVQGYATGDRVAVAPAVPCGECVYCRRGAQGMCDNLTAIGYHYDGGFAEYLAAPPVAVRNGCVNHIPEGVSFEAAALAEPLACCINAQELSHMGLGHTVVVVGAGPIGCLNVQLANCCGAAKTILIDISPARLEMAHIVGADVYINSAEEDAISRVMDETYGLGANIVITACSVGAAQELSLKLVAKRGVVNFFGGLPKDRPTIDFDSNILHYREFYVVGNHGSAPRHNVTALGLIGSGKVETQALITNRLSIQETLDGIGITERAEGLKAIISGV